MQPNLRTGLPSRSDRDEVGLDIRIDPQRRALVYLQHRDVVLCHLAREIAAAQQRRRDTGDDVRAGAVRHDVPSLALEQTREHVAHGRLAVRAGDGHDRLRLSDVLQKVRADLQRERTGEVRPVVVRDGQRRDRQLRHPQRKVKSQLTHVVYSASSVVIAAARQLQPSAFSNFSATRKGALKVMPNRQEIHDLMRSE